MDLNAYQSAALRTMANQGDILQRLTETQVQLISGSIGLSDECGEIAACIKANVEYNKPLDRTNLKEEIGDALWRLTQIADAVDLTLEECAVANIKKLTVRYPLVFSDFLAAEENRDRSRERQVLEGRFIDIVKPEIKVVTNQGFAETQELPDEVVIKDVPTTVAAHFGDGLVRNGLSDTSYDRLCCICNKKPIHRTNQAGYCPDCGADVRAGRVEFPK